MKKWLIISVLLLLCPILAKAQLGNFGDTPVEINADETRFENGLAIGENNVVIRYGTTTIYCDYAQYSPDTRDVLVKGNVRIYREDHLIVGERAVFNFDTKVLRAADFRGEVYPFKFTAESIGSIGPKAFEAHDAIMTTSDSSKPDYYIKAKTVRIYQHDRVVFSNVLVYVGKTPVFWYPYLYQSLRRDSSFIMRPGYESVWGAYLLTQFTFPLGDNAIGKFHLDLRSLRGAAVGFDSTYKYGKNDESWGRFLTYYAHDSDPEKNETSYVRQAVGTNRYRVTLQQRAFFSDDIYANIDINKFSDALYLQDFLPSQFQVDPEPDNVVSLTKWDEDYTITGIVRAQLNNFFEKTERLPEFAFDLKRQPFFDTPIFYEGEASAGRLNRDFPSTSGYPDYGTTRADAFIQFLYPKTYFGWLSFVPRLGFRGTYYSSTGDSGNTIFDTSSTPALVNGVSYTAPQRPIVKGGSTFRPVITAGFESSFKLSRVFDDVEARKFGFDGLRHVVQPYTDFSYVNTGYNPDNILQFDRINPSTQLAPLDLSSFNSTDAITDWTIWRWGVRNRLETRRDNETFSWLDLDSYVDVNLQEPAYPGISYRQGSISNFFNNLRWNPLPWFTTRLDSQVPLNSKGFTEVDAIMSFMVNPNLKFDVGNRYINNNPFFVNSNLITFGSYFRLNDNWALSFNEQYEVHDHTLEYQTYQIHRDLSSWAAALGLVIRDNRVNGAGSLDYGIMLTFTLKDFPSISSPISFDPQSAASGK